jgi:CheY-like chemotaxis protein
VARRAAHVLVADDVEINREVVRQQLEQIGCTVDVAASGHEAIAQCRARSYDLVFMDCHMPGLDGFQATQAIRGAPGPNRATPIVALTASALSDERERCATVGMDDYLTKPIGQQELATCLDRHVDGRPAASETPVAPADTDGPRAVLDVEATLNRIGGNTRLFDRLVTIFRRQTPPLLTELRDALGGGDMPRARDAAHKLNGSLRSVGGRAAQEVAALLEQRALEGALADATALYDTLTHELARLDDAIGGYLAGNDARHGD